MRYYLYEFTKGGGYADDNQLIANLKKKLASSNAYEKKYKKEAIAKCAEALVGSINPKFLNGATFVPAPPSKAAGDVDYDNRMKVVCDELGKHVDVRELVTQKISMVASHERGVLPRIQIADLLAVYEIDEAQTNPVPHTLAIVDDVLTTGTHFKAMQHVLSKRFPDARIFGFFIARRVFAKPEFLY